MSEFLAFLQIGFTHIVAVDAADHILFLLVLAAIYRGRDWRAALVVISAFTVGHAVTLLLAATNTLVLPSRLVEFLIPVTIVATGIENLVLRDRAASGHFARHRPLFAVIFGLVHGAGFAGYLRSLFVDDIAIPLVGFNVGIELGQMVVLTAAAAAYLALDTAIGRVVLTRTPRSHASASSSQRSHGESLAFQWRLMSVSAVVSVIAAGWACERLQ